MKRLDEMTEPELQDLMLRCARAVQRELKGVARDTKQPQFVLVVFDDPKVAQYISSCTRESMIQAMYETAQRLSNKEDVPR